MRLQRRVRCPLARGNNLLVQRTISTRASAACSSDVAAAADAALLRACQPPLCLSPSLLQSFTTHEHGFVCALLMPTQTNILSGTRVCTHRQVPVSHHTHSFAARARADPAKATLLTERC